MIQLLELYFPSGNLVPQGTVCLPGTGTYPKFPETVVNSASQFVFVLDEASAENVPIVRLLVAKPSVEGHWHH